MHFAEWKSVVRQNSALIVLLLIFIGSRIVYFLLGVRFDDSLLLWSPHYIDRQLLISDFGRSIFYLHSQPPIMNLFLGIVLHLFPNYETNIFWFCYLLLGLTLMLSFYLLLKNLGVVTPLTVIFPALFIISPGAILYENWLFYSYPVCTALTFSALICLKFFKSPRLVYSLLLFFSLGIVALMWSFFHLLWLVAGVAILLTLRPQEWKRIVLGFTIPFILVLGWYVKNAILFGEFTASTWFGMNFSRITTCMLSLEERKQLNTNGIISVFSTLTAFGDLDQYQPYLKPVPLTGIPVLDQKRKASGFPNLNNIAYIHIFRERAKDAFRVITLKPNAYFRGIIRAVLIFFTPADDYLYFGKNRTKIETFARVFNTIFAGQFNRYINPKFRVTKPVLHYLLVMAHTGLFIIIGYGGAFIAGILLLRSHHANFVSQTLIFIWMTLLYGLLVGTLTEVGENNRFRFVFDPLMLAFVGTIIRPDSGFFLDQRKKQGIS